MDDSGMEVSFVVDAKRTPTGRSKPVGPQGTTRTQVVKALHKLTRPLRPHSVNMHVRKHARVPIINMVTRFGFECDIALGGHNGTDTSSYATTQLSRFKSFSTLVVFLKVLLNQQGLDKPFTGGLGSYTLYVLVASHVSMSPLCTDLLLRCRTMLHDILTFFILCVSRLSNISNSEVPMILRNCYLPFSFAMAVSSTPTIK